MNFRYSDVAGSLLIYDLPLGAYLPWVYMVYLGTSSATSHARLALSVSVLFGFAVSWAGYIVGGIQLFRTFMFPIVGFSCAAALRAALPPRMGLMSAAWQVTMLGVIVCLYFVTVPMLVERGNDLLAMLQLLCFFPVIKELVRLGSSRAAFRMAYEVGGVERIELRRQQGVCVVMWGQLLCAIWLRFQFASFSDKRTMAFAVVAQNLQEIVMRLTFERRDAFFARCCRDRKTETVFSATLTSERRSTSVIPMPAEAPTAGKGELPPSPSDSPKQTKAERKVSRREARKEFLSLAMCTDQLSEYFAIISTSTALVLAAPDVRVAHANLGPLSVLTASLPTQPLALRYPALLGSTDPFEQRGYAFFPNLLPFAVQLVCELATDAICNAAESRRGFDLRSAWKDRFDGFSAAFLITGIASFVSASALSTGADDFSLCRGQDMCFCSGGNGLVPGGVAESYCMYLYHQNTSEAPPGP